MEDIDDDWRREDSARLDRRSDVGESRGAGRFMAVFLCCVLGIVAVRIAWPTYEHRRLGLETMAVVADDIATRYSGQVRPAIDRGLAGQPVTIGELCMLTCEPVGAPWPEDELAQALYRSLDISSDVEQRVIGPAQAWNQLLLTGTHAMTDTVDTATIASLAELDIEATAVETAASLRSDVRRLDLIADAGVVMQWVLGAIAVGSIVMAFRLRPRTRLSDKRPDSAVV
jgi:hypothetical protein